MSVWWTDANVALVASMRTLLLINQQLVVDTLQTGMNVRPKLYNAEMGFQLWMKLSSEHFLGHITIELHHCFIYVTCRTQLIAKQLRIVIIFTLLPPSGRHQVRTQTISYKIC